MQLFNIYTLHLRYVNTDFDMLYYILINYTSTYFSNYNENFFKFPTFTFFLGELSSRYSGRARIPHSAGLNEVLQLWMSCRATRTLIDINTQCLSCLMHSDTEACINALLGKKIYYYQLLQFIEFFKISKYLVSFEKTLGCLPLWNTQRIL